MFLESGRVHDAVFARDRVCKVYVRSQSNPKQNKTAASSLQKLKDLRWTLPKHGLGFRGLGFRV